MANFAPIIKRLRTERGITQEQLASLLKVSRSTIGMYETGGREPDFETCEAIADIFNVDMDYLLGRSSVERKHPITPSPIPPGFAVPGDKTPLPAGATAMNPHQVAPLLGTVRAGLPMYAEENIVDYIPIRQTDGASYFWLTVRGDSMNAAGMEDGDQILVRTQPEAENGQLAVVMVNGNEATVKYFRREGDLVILTPKSFNPVHQPQIYDLKRVPVQIAGLVVECRKVFR